MGTQSKALPNRWLPIKNIQITDTSPKENRWISTEKTHATSPLVCVCACVNLYLIGSIDPYWLIIGYWYPPHPTLHWFIRYLCGHLNISVCLPLPTGGSSAAEDWPAPSHGLYVVHMTWMLQRVRHAAWCAYVFCPFMEVHLNKAVFVSLPLIEPSWSLLNFRCLLCNSVLVFIHCEKEYSIWILKQKFNIRTSK